MTEWILDIETPDSVAASADDLERFAEALGLARGKTGAAASLDRTTGALTVSFAVDAADAVAATDIGVAAVRAASAAIGLDCEPVRVAVERLGHDAPVAV